MTAEKIATLISRPESILFFEKSTREKLEIGCKYGWISQNISPKVNFRGGEIEILENILETKFAEHVNEYWMENGKITRDLESRSIGEWIENEICFLAGFALWFREKEKEGEIDLSTLVSQAMGEDVTAGAQIDFERKRIELLSELPSNALSVLKDMNPAGKIAYRSMDMAIIKGISEGDDARAMNMKQRTQILQKPWWKFW
ncbi:MAG: hypothetical protein VYA07_00245 [Candidatus Thermoplasmatota archaeon]|nr:hypothetical protein [Candidatus Thermoplasmatota archaeon]